MIMTKRIGFLVVAAIVAVVAAVAATMVHKEIPAAKDPPAARQVPAPHASGDPVHGKMVYQACMGCHSLNDNDLGPKHRGVVGRVAGTVPDYAYSPALKQSGITWNPATLDRWLTNPQALVPGTKMLFAVPDAKDRTDVIAYLAEQR
jgi:cytochrome c